MVHEGCISDLLLLTLCLFTVCMAWEWRVGWYITYHLTGLFMLKIMHCDALGPMKTSHQCQCWLYVQIFCRTLSIMCSVKVKLRRYN